jgi:amidase
MASRKRKLERDWRDVAREAQEHRDASIGKVPSITHVLDRLEGLESVPKCSIDVPSNILDPKDIHITQCLPEKLLAMLGRGEITSVEVTTAFLRRATVAQKLVRSL